MIGRRSNDDAQSFEEAWSGRAPRDEHIAELVQFVEGLCEAAVAEPSMEFRQTLRTQLLHEAETALVPLTAGPRATAPVHELRPVRRRVAGVTTALIASAGVIGLVASSASAVPGEMLYPVKRGVESIELALHRDDASRGSFQLAQASERLAEAGELSADSDSEQLIADTLDDFAAQAQSGSTALFSDFTDNGKEKSIRTVNDFAAAATANLSALSAQIPSGAGDSLDAATETVSDMATQASSLCASCTSIDVQQVVRAIDSLSKDASATSLDPAEKPVDSSDSGHEARSSHRAAPVPTQPPAAIAPPPTANAPSLTDITDPVAGALLGDEEQVGLVPGLLNELLGDSTK